MSETAPWFEREPRALHALETTLQRCYPTLHAFAEDGVCHVQGSIEIVPGDRYYVDIALPANYPHAAPSVWETANRIPRELERHTFPDGSLCLGTPLSLCLDLQGDFSIEKVIDIALRNFLVGNSLVEEGKPWPYGDRAHGSAGIVEHFGELIGTTDPAAIGRFLLALMDGKVRGHWDCPCGSGLVIRKCHRDAVERLRNSPYGLLRHAAEMMAQELKRRREQAA